jgi:hypothetical protein
LCPQGHYRRIPYHDGKSTEPARGQTWFSGGISNHATAIYCAVSKSSPCLVGAIDPDRFLD